MKSHSKSKNILTAPIPKTRDPFCNTPPIPLGRDEKGRERFWISTYNKNEGSTGVTVSEDGEYRVYRWKNYCGGYFSAVAENKDTVWLCGNTSFVLRMDLKSGKCRKYDTGAPAAPMHYGMTFEPKTRKLFAMSQNKYDSVAFSFDTRNGKTARIFQGLTGTRTSSSFRNPDGTLTILTNKSTAVRWDPKRDTIKESPIRGRARDKAYGFISPPVLDDRGRAYLSGRGWLDPRDMKLRSSGPRPEREAIWFGKRNHAAWGAIMREDDVEVVRWDMRKGKVSHLCRIRDCHIFGVACTARGDVVAVNMFGVFTRHDSETGILKCSRALPVEAVGQMDCVCRIDKNRILGTPYISQRFWEVNIRTGKGFDCGRAAPGVGEILLTVKIKGKIYMAAYTSGELVEYDPSRSPCFPDNPRVVATPPDSMRPVTAADNGRIMWYACNKPYGTLGSVLTRYDTTTGLSSFAEDPLHLFQIRGLLCRKRNNSLYCGTAIHADGYSATPEHDRAVYAHLDADTLEVRETVPAPEGITYTYIEGILGPGRLLVVCLDESNRRKWGVLRTDPLRAPAIEDLKDLPVNGPPHYTGKPGCFAFATSDKVEMWDLRKNKCLKTLYKRPRGWEPSYKCAIQDNCMMLVLPKKVVLIEDINGARKTARKKKA